MSLQEMNDEIGHCNEKLYASIRRLEDLRDGATILGLKPLAEKLHYEIKELQDLPQRLSKAAGGAIQESFQRAQESSDNILKVGLAIAADPEGMKKLLDAGKLQ